MESLGTFLLVAFSTVILIPTFILHVCDINRKYVNKLSLNMLRPTFQKYINGTVIRNLWKWATKFSANFSKFLELVLYSIMQIYIVHSILAISIGSIVNNTRVSKTYDVPTSASLSILRPDNSYETKGHIQTSLHHRFSLSLKHLSSSIH